MKQKTILFGGIAAAILFFLYERSKSNAIVPGTNLTRAQLSGLPPSTAGVVAGVGGIISGIGNIFNGFNSQGTAAGNGPVTVDSTAQVATVGDLFPATPDSLRAVDNTWSF